MKNRQKKRRSNTKSLRAIHRDIADDRRKNPPPSIIDKVAAAARGRRG